MLGPKRSITGRGAPVPKSVTLRFCEECGRGKGDGRNEEQDGFRPQTFARHGFINLRVRRFGLPGNVRAGFHELNNGIGEL